LILSELPKSMGDERTIAELIKTEAGEIVAYVWHRFMQLNKRREKNGAKSIQSSTGCENIKSQGLHMKTGCYQYWYSYEKILDEDS